MRRFIFKPKNICWEQGRGLFAAILEKSSSEDLWWIFMTGTNCDESKHLVFPNFHDSLK